MSKWTYTPEAWKVKRVYDTPEYDFLVKRARECILWRMSPSEYDALDTLEYLAWHEAWKEICDEQKGD